MNTNDTSNPNITPEFTYIQCPNCSGYGSKGFNKVICPSCNGTGVLKVPVKEEKQNG